MTDNVFDATLNCALSIYICFICCIPSSDHFTVSVVVGSCMCNWYNECGEGVVIIDVSGRSIVHCSVSSSLLHFVSCGKLYTAQL